MSFTPYPTHHETVCTSSLEGPKLITFIGRKLQADVPGEPDEPIAGTLELNNAKLRVIVRTGLFLPAKSRLTFGQTSYVISYEARD